MYFLTYFAFLCAFATRCNCETKTDAKIYLTNNHGLDYKFQGKRDEHRFGVELDENRQFHHTITDADGVRLGCYGYEIFGQKYSTNYIADGKGYRLAPKNSDVITVFAKDTLEPRKASFLGSFGQSEVKSGHIRYLFPEGCEAPKVHFDPLTREDNRRQLIEALQNEALDNQKAKNLQRGSIKQSLTENQRAQNENLRTTASVRVAATTTKTTFATKATTISPIDILTTTTEGIIGRSVQPQQGESDLSVPVEPLIQNVTPETLQLNINENIQRRNKLLDEEEVDDAPNNEEDEKCCENDRLQIILPQASVDTCQRNRMARISIPISVEKLSSVPMNELLNLSSTRSTLSVLKNLLQLVEKYNL